MQSIRTRFTEQFNVKLPILNAPMAIPGIAHIASAVTSNGGFGLVSAAFDGPEGIHALRNLRRELAIPSDSTIPVGVGFIGWFLDSFPSEESSARVKAALDEHPAIVWFAFGNDLGKYISLVHEHNAKQKQELKTLIFVNVNSVPEALQATKEWKVDGLAVQGIEAGGHGGANAPPLLDLLPAVISALPNGPFILAAGGIATGKQIAAMLVLGADAVVLGTRFLFTNECGWSDQKKEILVEAEFGSTKRGMMFDDMLKLHDWPEVINGRAISNGIVRDVEEGLDLETRLARYEEGGKKGEKDRVVVWAGVGVGLTKEIKSTAVVVHELHEDILNALRATNQLLSA
ncbi:2-nitropropane dioxygenase [Abortiporus biennis]|nr:2-nitropropane dioxygenase [Abortiporus biennis]